MVHDLTRGRVTPQLIRFTVPLVLGNLFQLTYNAVDSMIVGRFVSKEALAGVGTVNPVMTLLILFLNGLCLGAGVLMGQYFGAGDENGLRRQISTTMLAGAVFSLAMSAVCVLLSHPLLTLLQVKESVRPIAVVYMRIIFAGLIFTYFYNFLSSTLRSLGDTMTPLYFLAISAVLNLLGDLFFVVVLPWGAAGCALATVLSEGLSALFCLLYIRKKVPVLRLGKDWLVFDRSLLKRTVAFSWAGAMQQATVQMGKIAVQGIVNTVSVTASAAFTAVNRMDDFAMTPEQNIAHAMTAFMAQNKGAGKKDRMKQGFKEGLILEAAYGVLIALITLLFARPFMSLFSKDAGVIEAGAGYLRLIGVMYILPAFTNGVQGYFRGNGDLRITLISSMVNMGTRVIAAAVLVFGFHLGLEAVPWSYLVGWVCMLACEVPVLLKRMLTERRA